MSEDSTGRSFERTSSNVLPHRATIAKATADFDPVYSDPFVPDEIVAARDEPKQPFFIARSTPTTSTANAVHYHGCTSADVARAAFRPGWHLENSNDIALSNDQPPNHVPRVGTIELDSLGNLLVARNLEFKKAARLRKKSQRAIAPVKEELFTFEK
jgi:hypothetical protein